MEEAANELFFKKRSSLKLRNIHRDIATYNIAGLQFYQKETPTLTFSCEYYKIFKNN